MNIEVMSVLFHHPCNIYISGPSGSGKTEFVQKLIDYKDDVFTISPQKVVYCYKEWQHTYTIMQEKYDFIKFIEGIPDDEDEIVNDTTTPHLVVFDDMLGEKDEDKIKLWFTRKGHHRNASIVYITQNMFQQTKSSRTISLNARYMVLFRNERDGSQIKTLAHQMQSPHLISAYHEATSTPHGYLIIDFHSSTPRNLKFRTDIFHRWLTKHEHRGPMIYIPL